MLFTENAYWPLGLMEIELNIHIAYMSPVSFLAATAVLVSPVPYVTSKCFPIFVSFKVIRSEEPGKLSETFNKKL